MVDSYVCVDIETSGIRSKWDRIIEIGAVKVVQGKIVDTFSELINPGVPLSPFITQLTGIDDSMVKDCEPIEVILPKFISFSEDYPLLGHNLAFDFAFLKQNAENLNCQFEKNGLDTLKISRKVHKELESRSLEYLCGYYGIADENHHRAFNDASVTSQLYLKLKERFGESNPELFECSELKHKIKKLQPITDKQKKYLTDLCRYHKITMDFDLELLSRNEASKKIDKILTEKGRILY
jgi:DNA polymerase-3 subunit alpha (Gram-positive type)